MNENAIKFHFYRIPIDAAGMDNEVREKNKDFT